MMDLVKRAALYALTWLVAVTVATGVALAAVQAVGDAALDRGPLGPAVQPIEETELGAIPTDGPDAWPKVTKVMRGQYGAFVVSCLGPYAVGENVTAEDEDGWQAISFEPGPDDDVDAVFAKDTLSLEVEVYCNQGSPTIADIERNRFTGS
jgi:hypothetical protein